MDIDFKCWIKEPGLEAEGTAEPFRVLEEGRNGSEISCSHDCVEGCLEGVNRSQETREDACGVSSGADEGRILPG